MLRASWTQLAFPDWTDEADRKDPRNGYTEYCHGVVVGPLLNFDGSLWLALLEDGKNRVIHLPAEQVTVSTPRS
jgi:hypothetical protein